MSRYAYERGTRVISIGAAGSFGKVPANNGTGTGAGDEFGFAADLGTSRLPSNFTWDIIVTGGTLDQLVVLLEGSLNGINWFTMDQNSLLAGELRSVQQKPVRFLRGNITTFHASSGTPVVEVGISS